MQVIKARNVGQAFPEVMYHLKHHGVRMDSRNGPVVKIPEPCTILYEKPEERVLFCKERDANPFFHLMESLWMLAGRNDLAFPVSIVKNMANFSDDGKILQGAYGYRWRQHFGYDQLSRIAYALKADHTCRRQVLQLWDAKNDLGLPSKDLPCNTQIYFSINHEGQLDMMVTNRSNDAVWGALGANAVHMSILQEFMAGWIDVPIGRYWQVSNNLHLYLREHEDLMNLMAERAFPSGQYKYNDPYECQTVKPTPLLPKGDIDKFQQDLKIFLDEGLVLGIRDSFLFRVAAPMLTAIRVYKQTPAPKRFELMEKELSKMDPSLDWCQAAKCWLLIRHHRWEEKQREHDD